MADPDLELRWEGRGGGVIYLPCWLFSLLLFLLFYTKDKPLPLIRHCVSNSLFVPHLGHISRIQQCNENCPLASLA